MSFPLDACTILLHRMIPYTGTLKKEKHDEQQQLRTSLRPT